MGAAAGYGGGLLMGPASAGAAAEGAGGLLSNPVANAQAAAEYGTNIGSQQTAMLAAQDAALKGAGQSALGSAMGMVKPVGEAMGAANATKNLFSHQEKPITPSPMMTPMPNSNLGQMVSGLQQQQANQMAQDEQMRMMRRKARGFA